jgi:hypothetical protein
MRVTGPLILCVCILVSGPVFSQERPAAELPPGVTVLNFKSEDFAVLTTGSGAPTQAPDSNLNRVLLAGGGASSTVVRTQLFAYSIQLANDGPKPIKAIAWDFIFADVVSDAELRRHSFANLQTIDLKQKKTLKFTTHLSPPSVVSAEALAKNPEAPFKQKVAIRCVLYSDDSTWHPADVTGSACQNLRTWLARRKKWRSRFEDPPLVFDAGS